MSERPKKGDRVVVRWEGVLLEDDKKDRLPFRVSTTPDGKDDPYGLYGLWVPEGAVAVKEPAVAEQELPVLAAKVDALVADTARNFQALGERIVELHKHLNFAHARVRVLEQQMASLRSALHNAGNVTGEDGGSDGSC